MITKNLTILHGQLLPRATTTKLQKKTKEKQTSTHFQLHQFGFNIHIYRASKYKYIQLFGRQTHMQIHIKHEIQFIFGVSSKCVPMIHAIHRVKHIEYSI